MLVAQDEVFERERCGRGEPTGSLPGLLIAQESLSRDGR